jgi:DNA-binding IclR family transcriptional regulator
VWALELLCHLRRHADRSLPAAELVDSLRASDLVVRRSLAELVAAGLVSIEADETARYAPATAGLDKLATAAEARYASSPNAVRRIIVRAANPGLTAFSDAFRLGGDS